MIQRYPTLGLTLDEDHADPGDALLLGALEDAYAAHRADVGHRIVDGLEVLMPLVTGLATAGADAALGRLGPFDRDEVLQAADVLERITAALRALPATLPGGPLTGLLATKPGVERLEP